LLVAPDRPEELHAALVQLIGDDTLRERMGEAGARRVHHVTNYRTMAAGMEQIYLETIGKVGSQRQARREQLWPRELSLFAPSDACCYSGSWITQEAAPGQPYRVGQPGAVLTFEAHGGTILRLVTLRHNWSGVLEVHADDTRIGYIDLYKAAELQLNHTINLQLPGEPSNRVIVRLKVHSEHNPESHASQVWLKHVAFILPPDPLLLEADVCASVDGEKVPCHSQG
jgi:hypothetical protein